MGEGGVFNEFYLVMMLMVFANEEWVRRSFLYDFSAVWLAVVVLVVLVYSVHTSTVLPCKLAVVVAGKI